MALIVAMMGTIAWILQKARAAGTYKEEMVKAIKELTKKMLDAMSVERGLYRADVSYNPSQCETREEKSTRP